MSFEPTRRSVLQAGIWTAPVVVAASAVPAMAASASPGTPIFMPGNTRAVIARASLRAVQFRGASATVVGGAAAGQLRMTVSLRNASLLFIDANIPGWTDWTASDDGLLAFCTNAAAIPAGSALPIPDEDAGGYGRGVYFDCNPEPGIFDLVFTFGNKSTATVSYNTANAPSIDSARQVSDLPATERQRRGLD